MVQNDDAVPEMAAHEARAASYADFPLSSPDPASLAAAGLFFAPTEARPDQCKCFACGISLFEWDPEDDAFQEHKKRRPLCRAVSLDPVDRGVVEETLASDAVSLPDHIKSDSSDDVSVGDNNLQKEDSDASTAADLYGGWTTVSSPDGDYYWNTRTSEVAWELPAQFAALEEVLPRTAADAASTSAAMRRHRATMERHLVDAADVIYNPEDESTIIGKGVSAAVFRGTFRGQPAAIKQLKQGASGDCREEFNREVEVLSKLTKGHGEPGVVKFLGATLEPRLLLITELMHETLLDRLDRAIPGASAWASSPSLSRGRARGVLKWKEALFYAIEIARALRSLHSRPVPLIHRDIKSNNVLLSKDGRMVKLCDLGISTFAELSGFQVLRKPRGTPVYIAPEAYQYGLEDESKGKKPSAMSAKSTTGVPPRLRTTGAQTVALATSQDTYGFGILLWEIATTCFHGKRMIPYHSDDKGLTDAAIMIRVAKHGMRPTIRPETPAELAEIMEQCWHVKPHYRPTMTDVVARLERCIADALVDKDKWVYEWRALNRTSSFTRWSHNFRGPKRAHQISVSSEEQTATSSEKDQESLSNGDAVVPKKPIVTETLGRTRTGAELKSIRTLSDASDGRPRLRYTDSIGRRSRGTSAPDRPALKSLAAYMKQDQPQEVTQESVSQSEGPQGLSSGLNSLRRKARGVRLALAKSNKDETG